MAAISKRGWFKPVGPGLNRVLDRYLRGTNLIADRFTKEAHSQMKEKGQAISCKEGCDYCCYLTFACTLLDGLLIARYLLAYQRDKVQTLWPVLADHAKLQESMTPVDWFQLQKPCAFLDEHRCLVYPVRPMNCRVQLVVSPPELCLGPELHTTRQINGQPAHDLHMELATEVFERLRKGGNVIMGALPTMVAHGLRMLIDNDVSFDSVAMPETDADKFREKWTRPKEPDGES